MEKKFKGRPPRLGEVFQSYPSPLYFITICSLHRQCVLASGEIHEQFLTYARQGVEMERAWVGKYVLMPDHFHLFVRLGANQRLGLWVKGLKRAVKGVPWQPGFFDHLMRNADSYTEKWAYVERNPVRAGLVQDPKTWPFTGEVYPLGL